MNRIKFLRLKNKLKQEELSKIINVSQASLSGYENGKYEPDNKTLLNLSAYFGVTTDYLLGNNNKHEFSAKKIPVLGNVRAGRSGETAKNILGYEEINEDMAQKGEYFALKMHGDSMAPRIQDGDIVIVQSPSEVKSGDVAAISVDGNDATIKKIVKYEGGITLIPYNPRYDLISFTKEEMNHLPVIIIGKAVELRGKC